MARIIKPRKSNFTVVVIIDGEDEKWYLEKVKEHYRPDILRKIKVEPALAQKKKVAELFVEAEKQVKAGSSKVVLIVDFDDIGKSDKELSEFKKWYAWYQNVNNGNTKKHAWMEHLELIINSPCIEFWYLLHFRKTTKYYPNFQSMHHDLTAIPMLSDYEKTNTYYMKRPNIFLRLGGDDGLKQARKNAIPFNIEYCQNQGISEMNRLFDFFDSLKL